MRGTIRLWWRFTRTEAAPSPVSARLFNASKADSNRSWHEEGDRSCHQESAFSFRTLPVKGGRPGSSLRR
jgi:enterochelin esterase-like enzyme